MRIIKDGRAWCNKRDGTELTKASLAMILNRVLNDLEKGGVIESKIEVRKDGFPIRFVRVKGNVIDNIASYIDKMGTSGTFSGGRSPFLKLSASDRTSNSVSSSIACSSSAVSSVDNPPSAYTAKPSLSQDGKRL